MKPLDLFSLVEFSLVMQGVGFRTTGDFRYPHGGECKIPKFLTGLVLIGSRFTCRWKLFRPNIS